MNAAGRPAHLARRPQPTPEGAAARYALLVLALITAMQPQPVSGGLCWESMEPNGKCKELAGEHVSKEECCSASQPVAAAWSPNDLEPGALFFWRVLGEGVSCTGCRESCSGVQCGPGRRCTIRKGRPRCVCAPQCGSGRSGSVCGTDGRTYRSLCRLRKRACRRRTRDLTVNYYGTCQSSCLYIKCGAGRQCLVDRDERAHCVRCTRSCPRGPPESRESQGQGQGQQRALCGVDGRTYPSPCHLKAAACRAGRSIPMAYRGPCNLNATCDIVRCKARQQCLVDPRSGAPRCVTCGARCPRAPRPRRALCANNNRTYFSWCHMVKDACATGFVIDTKHPGACTDSLDDNINNIHEEEKEEEEFESSI